MSFDYTYKITGTLSVTRKEAEKKISSNGGWFTEKESKDYDFQKILIVGKNPGSNSINKAIENGNRMITEKELEKKYGISLNTNDYESVLMYYDDEEDLEHLHGIDLDEYKEIIEKVKKGELRMGLDDGSKIPIPFETKIEVLEVWQGAQSYGIWIWKEYK